jgi:hypothetical protein
VESDENADEIGDFAFENTAVSGTIDAIEVAIRIREEATSSDKIEVWMWESSGGWEKVGEIDPTTVESWSIVTIDISSKFDTIAKINEAEMRLKYVKV